MRKKMQGKKWLSILLVVMMLVSLMPTAAFADDEVASNSVEVTEGTLLTETTITEDEAANQDATVTEPIISTDSDENDESKSDTNILDTDLTDEDATDEPESGIEPDESTTVSDKAQISMFKAVQMKEQLPAKMVTLNISSQGRRTYGDENAPDNAAYKGNISYSYEYNGESVTGDAVLLYDGSDNGLNVYDYQISVPEDLKQITLTASGTTYEFDGKAVTTEFLLWGVPEKAGSSLQHEKLSDNATYTVDLQELNNGKGDYIFRLEVVFAPQTEKADKALYAYGHVFNVDGKSVIFDKDGQPVEEPIEVEVDTEDNVTLSALQKMPKGYEDYELSYISVANAQGEFVEKLNEGEQEVTITPAFDSNMAVTATFVYEKQKQPEGKNAQFFIRKDNSMIPVENGKTQYPKSGYTNHHLMYGTVTGSANVNNVEIALDQYTVDALQNQFKLVDEAIISRPDEKTINQALQKSGLDMTYDPDKQIVLWYVVKSVNDSCKFHVDGVILDKDAVYYKLHYEANTGDPAIDAVIDVPKDEMCKAGDSVQVDQGSHMQRNGYVFKGWALDKAGQEPITEQTILMDSAKTLYAIWEKKPAVTILTYYDGALKHHSPVETKEIGTNFNFDNIKDEVEYNRAQYKLAYVGYMIGENAEAVDKNNTELTPGSEAITLESGNTYQIHVYYERIPQGNLTVVHQMTYKDKAGHVVGEPIVLKQNSSLQKVGSEFKAADLILADYANYYVSADPETVTIQEGLNQMTLKYEKTVDVSVESPLLIHHYQTIVNGVIAEEKVVEETIQSVQGQPFKTGDSIFIKDHAREKDGYKMTSTSCDGTEGFLTLGLESTANKADIYYQKEVAEWTVKYIDEAEVSIAEDLTGRIAPDAEITEDLVLGGTAIKKNITEYTYKTMRIDADDHVIYMIYKVKETTGPVNPGEDVTPGGDGGNTPGGDGGSTSGGGDNNGGSGNTETVIPDNNTPLAPNAPTTPDNTVVVPAEVVIDENEVPLSESPKENSDNPKTGTAQAKDLSALALLLAAGALGIEFKRKKA